MTLLTGKDARKRRALTELAFHLDGGIHAFDDVLDDAQSHPLQDPPARHPMAPVSMNREKDHGGVAKRAQGSLREHLGGFRAL